MDFVLFVGLALIYFELNAIGKCLKILVAIQAGVVPPEKEEIVKSNLEEAMK